MSRDIGAFSRAAEGVAGFGVAGVEPLGCAIPALPRGRELSWFTTLFSLLFITALGELLSRFETDVEFVARAFPALPWATVLRLTRDGFALCGTAVNLDCVGAPLLFPVSVPDADPAKRSAEERTNDEAGELFAAGENELSAVGEDDAMPELTELCDEL